jgi:NAD(P)H dehydrogenase (quinone)
MTILVTATSGPFGRAVVQSLLAAGVPASDIRAGARTIDKAADLGVEVVHLDYSDPASIGTALVGVDSLLLVSGSEVGQRVAQHSNVIEAAAAAGVSHLVYTSAPAATTSALVLAPEHKATEEAIAASGIPATILRNSWYTENYVSVVEQARSTGEIVSSVGEGRVASASRADYAQAAAEVLTSPEHVGATYELSGDVAWTFTELAGVATELVGSPVTYRSVTPEEHAEYLAAAGLDAGTVGFIVALDGNIRDGLLAVTTGDLSRIIGRPTTPLAEGLREAL